MSALSRFTCSDTSTKKLSDSMNVKRMMRTGSSLQCTKSWESALHTKGSLAKKTFNQASTARETKSLSRGYKLESINTGCRLPRYWNNVGRIQYLPTASPRPGELF